MSRLLITIIIVLLPMSVVLSVEQKTKDNPMLLPETATETTDIHYTGKFCSECHEKTPTKKGAGKFLKFGGNFTQLCRCHGYEPGNYIHPVDIAPSEEKKARIPNDFPLENGKVTCATCHDIYLQCRLSERLKLLNKKFLRGAPFRKRTDICIKCHDEKKYKMLDPHNQLTANGDIIVEKCLYCHVEKPDVEHATFKEVKLVGNLEVLCQRCHGERNHPANANHLREPSPGTLETMKAEEKEFGIVLPLDYDGKVTCATCHNPHEKGVIPAERLGAKGAGEKYKHRLPGQICMACHKK